MLRKSRLKKARKEAFADAKAIVMIMKERNICKFIEAKSKETLSAVTFVRERNKAIMEAVTALYNNRMILISSGSGVINIDDRSMSVENGDLIFVFSGERFFANGRESFEYMYIDFVGTRSAELFRRFSIMRDNRHFSGYGVLISFWRDALSRANEINIDLVSECVILYTLSQLSESNIHIRGAAEELLAIIEEDFNDSALSINKVAQDMGYNAKYLSHCFKEKMGMGFSEYLRTIRIKHAVFLMEHGIESVKNIAFLCGFSDPLYFSSVFKKITGVSPSDYIKKNTAE